MGGAILNIEKKKGDPEILDGQVTVYAKVDVDMTDLAVIDNPMTSMIHGGLIAVQGNYREQHSIKDFLREAGILADGSSDIPGVDTDDGLGEMLGDMGGIESALDPKKFRKKLEELEDIGDFIPTPATPVPFHSEDEIMLQPGDVYYAGSYKKIGNAVLGINAVPIIYQAIFREQQMNVLKGEIETLINQIERGLTDGRVITAPNENPSEALLKEYIPRLLYERNDPTSFAQAQKQFREFMSGYRFKDDVDAIITLVTKNRNISETNYKLLELYAKKISSVISENFAEAETVRRQIENFSS